MGLRVRCSEQIGPSTDRFLVDDRSRKSSRRLPHRRFDKEPDNRPREPASLVSVSPAASSPQLDGGRATKQQLRRRSFPRLISEAFRVAWRASMRTLYFTICRPASAVCAPLRTEPASWNFFRRDREPARPRDPRSSAAYGGTGSYPARPILSGHSFRLQTLEHFPYLKS